MKDKKSHEEVNKAQTAYRKRKHRKWIESQVVADEINTKDEIQIAVKGRVHVCVRNNVMWNGISVLYSG